MMVGHLAVSKVVHLAEMLASGSVETSAGQMVDLKAVMTGFERVVRWVVKMVACSENLWVDMMDFQTVECLVERKVAYLALSKAVQWVAKKALQKVDTMVVKWVVHWVVLWDFEKVAQRVASSVALMAVLTDDK